MEKVCVLGAGSTKYGKLEDSISDITIQASVGAIEMLELNLKRFKQVTSPMCLVLQTSRCTWVLLL